MKRIIRPSVELGSLEIELCDTTNLSILQCPCDECFKLKSLKPKQTADREFAEQYAEESTTKQTQKWKDRGFGIGHFADLKGHAK